jgi:heat shock protein HtpX
MENAIPLSLLEQRRHRWRNNIHTWLLATGSLLLLAVTAYVFAGPTGVVAAIVFGGITMAAAQRVSARLVLRMYKAHPVGRSQFPLGIDLIEQLAKRAKLPAAPKLHVVPSQMLNAFAVGRREDSAIAITDALARRLTPRELAGVLAHEISHIAHEDLRVMAFADMVARYTSFMSTVGIMMLFFNIVGFAGGYGPQIPWLGVAVLLVAPTIGGLLQLALSRTREFDADLGAVLLTGDPEGLASALQKLERAQGRLWESMMLPGGRNPQPSVLRSHPLTAQRIERLMTGRCVREAAARASLARAAHTPQARYAHPVGDRRHRPDHRRTVARPAIR